MRHRVQGVKKKVWSTPSILLLTNPNHDPATPINDRITTKNHRSLSNPNMYHNAIFCRGPNNTPMIIKIYEHGQIFFFNFDQTSPFHFSTTKSSFFPRHLRESFLFLAIGRIQPPFLLLGWLLTNVVLISLNVQFIFYLGSVGSPTP